MAGLNDRLAERGYRLDTWDVFLADRSTALLASKRILSRSLPAGLFELESPIDPTGERTQRIQSIIIEGGAKTLESFIDAELWDEARVFTADVEFGDGIFSPNIGGLLLSDTKETGDRLEIYRHVH